MRALVILLSLVFYLLHVAQVAAQSVGDVFDQFFRYIEVKNRVIEPHLPGETIDFFTGNLRISQEDLFLPGRGGLDLHVVRTYSSKIWGRSDIINDETLIAGKEPSFIGFGWSMHMGRLRNPTPTLSGPPPRQYPVYEGPDGTSRVFYGQNNQVLTSRDFWKLNLNCTLSVGGGQGVCITTTKGIRLEFAKSYQFYLGGINPIWPLSAMIDPFGNKIQVSYQPGGGAFGGSTGRIATITDSYQRQITFNYSPPCNNTASQPVGCHLNSITASPASGGGTRSVYYAYTSSQGGGAGYPLSTTRDFLTGAKLGVGNNFAGYTYDYYYTDSVGHNQFALKTITYPYGGATQYFYDDQQSGKPLFYTGCSLSTIRMPAVIKRVLSGQHDPAGVWTYQYTPSASPVPGASGIDTNPGHSYATDFQTTQVTRPDMVATSGSATNAVDTYQFYGFGYRERVGSGWAWMVGLQSKITRGSGAQVETMDWDPGPTVASDSGIYSAPNYGDNGCPSNALLSDNMVQAPYLKSDTTTRGGATYTSVMSNADQYGQPGTVEETGEKNRTTTYQYWYNSNTTSPQILLGLVTHEKICGSGSDCFENTRTFSDSYPNYHHRKDSETLKGVPTKFGYDTWGNLEAVTNALGETLTLDQYDKRTSDIDRFQRRFSPPSPATPTGTAASRTKPTRTDTPPLTPYDSGRLSTITPPGTNYPTTYCYLVNNSVSPAVETGYSTTRSATTSPVTCPGGNQSPTVQGDEYQESTTWDGLGRVWATSNSLPGELRRTNMTHWAS